MNGLTKLELHNVLNSVKYRRNQFTKDQVIIDRYETIILKVQSLIDDMVKQEKCDHRWVGWSNSPYYCELCGLVEGE